MNCNSVCVYTFLDEFKFDLPFTEEIGRLVLLRFNFDVDGFEDWNLESLPDLPTSVIAFLTFCIQLSLLITVAVR